MKICNYSNLEVYYDGVYSSGILSPNYCKKVRGFGHAAVPYKCNLFIYSIYDGLCTPSFVLIITYATKRKLRLYSRRQNSGQLHPAPNAHKVLPNIRLPENIVVHNTGGKNIFVKESKVVYYLNPGEFVPVRSKYLSIGSTDYCFSTRRYKVVNTKGVLFKGKDFYVTLPK